MMEEYGAFAPRTSSMSSEASDFENLLDDIGIDAPSGAIIGLDRRAAEVEMSDEFDAVLSKLGGLDADTEVQEILSGENDLAPLDISKSLNDPSTSIAPLQEREEESFAPDTSTRSSNYGCEEDDDIIDTIPIADGPMPHPSYEVTKSVLAEKMSQLSMKDREAVYYDIHGVQDIIDETAESGFLDGKLSEMADELQKMDATEKKAYEMARSVDPSYVDDHNFRLRFLRVERFNARLAALRYARHFDFKLELFGPDKIARDIIQDDLGEETLHSLYNGYAQVLPRRDSAGRPVWFWIGRQPESKEAKLRRMFYNAMLITEDVETQQKGTVLVFYALNQQQERRGAQGSNHVRSIVNAGRRLPLLIVSVHFCYDNYAWVPVLALAQASFNLFVSLRLRAHLGSHIESMYKLQTFGIPTDTVPIDENGVISIDNHKRRLEKRRELEREWAKKLNDDSKNDKNINNSRVGEDCTTLVPARCDVLLGRGKGYFNHVGNVRYRGLIEDLKGKYEEASRHERQMLAREVVCIVHQLGGRFLKDDGGVWIPIDDEAARLKVGHSFRALRPPSSTNNTKKKTAAKDGKRTSREEMVVSAATAKHMRR